MAYDYSISGVAIPGPEQIAHTPYQIMSALSGAPLRYGWRQMVFTYTILSPQNMALIYGLFNPATPIVPVTFWDPERGLVTLTDCMWQEVNAGTLDVAVFRGATLTFEYWTEADVTWDQAVIT